MSKIDDLIALGVISLDNTRPDGVIIHVPIKTTVTALLLDGFKLYAEASGWTATVEVPELDENDEPVRDALGFDVTNTVENPIKDYEAAIADVQEYVGKKFDEIIELQAQAAAQAQVAQLKTLFGR